MCVGRVCCCLCWSI